MIDEDLLEITAARKRGCMLTVLSNEKMLPQYVRDAGTAFKCSPKIEEHGRRWTAL